MADQVRRPAQNAPKRTYISACEALTWIAFGEPTPNKEFATPDLDLIFRWTTSQFSSVRTALEGRTAKHPYCAVRMGNDGYYPDALLSPAGPRILRKIRGNARRDDHRLTTFPELAAEIQQLLERGEHAQERVAQATDELLEALRAEKLTAFGQLSERGRPDTGAPFQPIPFNVFLHPAVTVTFWDTVGPDVSKPANAWRNLKGSDYSNVQFKTEQILTVWPIEGDPALASAVESSENYTMSNLRIHLGQDAPFARVRSRSLYGRDRIQGQPSIIEKMDGKIHVRTFLLSLDNLGEPRTAARIS